MEKERREKILSDICDRLNKEKLKPNEVLEVISQLIYSLGATLEDCDNLSGEEVLTRYAEKPTLGNVLMAQGIHMKELWNINENELEEREEEEENE